MILTRSPPCSLLVRQNEWALFLPKAEIIIIYAVLMISGGILTVVFYIAAKVKNKLTKISFIVNCLYSVAGITVLTLF